MKIKIREFQLKFLLTNCHVLSLDYVNAKKSITIYFGKKENEIANVITLDQNQRFIKCFEDYDVTVIEIFENDFTIQEINYLNPDYNYINGFGYYIGQNIYLAGYPSVKNTIGERYISSGKIKEINKKEVFKFYHTLDTRSGSSGSPICLIENQFVIGIHKSGSKILNLNMGTFIGIIINELQNIYPNHNKKQIDLSYIIKNDEMKYKTSDLESKNPITKIAFSLGISLDICHMELRNNKYTIINGDIRKSCGGKYGAIGIKKYRDFKDKPPITNIIGTISNKQQPDTIQENGCTYHLIKDFNNNGNIHFEECGCYCYLYYTTDNKYSPIKDIEFISYDKEAKNFIEMAQNSSLSESSGNLDIARMRGFKFNKGNWQPARYNYIIIYR